MPLPVSSRDQTMNKDALEDAKLNVIANLATDAAINSGKQFLAITTSGRISGIDFDYAYSIGRTDIGLPEIILTELEPKEAATLELMEVAVLTHPPESLLENQVFIIKGCLGKNGAARRFRWKKLDDISRLGVKRDFMTALPYRYSDDKVDEINVFQLLVSDKHGRLPDEPRYMGEYIVLDLVEPTN